MADEYDEFVKDMLKKAYKKDEKPIPTTPLSPKDKDPETTPQKPITDEDVKKAEEEVKKIKEQITA